ncbi:MAG: hypothetical protein WAM28_06085 [Chlamydiales bacterium]
MAAVGDAQEASKSPLIRLGDNIEKANFSMKDHKKAIILAVAITAIIAGAFLFAIYADNIGNVQGHIGTFINNVSHFATNLPSTVVNFGKEVFIPFATSSTGILSWVLTGLTISSLGGGYYAFRKNREINKKLVKARETIENKDLEIKRLEQQANQGDEYVEVSVAGSVAESPRRPVTEQRRPAVVSNDQIPEQYPLEPRSYREEEAILEEDSRYETVETLTGLENSPNLNSTWKRTREDHDGTTFRERLNTLDSELEANQD